VHKKRDLNFLRARLLSIFDKGISQTKILNMKVGFPWRAREKEVTQAPSTESFSSFVGVILEIE